MVLQQLAPSARGPSAATAAATAAAATARTEFLMVRHGETVWNVERRAQGSCDSPLTENGIAQAQLLALRLRQCSGAIAACYTSPLGRAQHTARLLVADADATVPITVEPGLTERCFGIFEGLTGEERRVKYPEVVAAEAAGGEEYAPPGGESDVQVQQRVMRALVAIASRHPGERVLVVTHGAVLANVGNAALGMPHTSKGGGSLALKNTAINVLRWQDGLWELVLWGDTGEFADAPDVHVAAAAMRLIGVGIGLGLAAGLCVGVLAARRASSRAFAMGWRRACLALSS